MVYFQHTRQDTVKDSLYTCTEAIAWTDIWKDRPGAYQTLVRDFKSRDIYICGPAGMMESLIKQLRLKDRIHYEKFSL